MKIYLFQIYNLQISNRLYHSIYELQDDMILPVDFV